MATVRSRMDATSAVPMQPLTPLVSQPVTQTATSQATPSQSTTLQGPQPATSSISGTFQTPISQQTALAASQAAFTASPPNNPGTSVSTSSSGSPTIASTASSPSQIDATPNNIEPKRGKWEKWINDPVGWISIILALTIGILAYKIGIKALVLQVWSARNDQRDSCWTDRDHGIYSKECNEILAQPATPPPSKRVAEQGLFFDDYSGWILLLACLIGSASVFMQGIYTNRVVTHHH